MWKSFTNSSYDVSSVARRSGLLFGAVIGAAIISLTIEEGLAYQGGLQCQAFNQACKKTVFTTNPCTYNVCRQVDNTCVPSGQAWTKVINQPASWPRCSTAAGPPGLVCDESAQSCGTTQHFYDSNCSMYCDPTDPGEWVGCRFLSDNCGT